jgi:hypothetical protein
MDALAQRKQSSPTVGKGALKVPQRSAAIVVFTRSAGGNQVS